MYSGSTTSNLHCTFPLLKELSVCTGHLMSYLKNVRNGNGKENTITDLLDFSRIGRQEVKTVEIDMRKLAHEVFDELRQVYPKPNIELKLGDIPPITGDRNLIRFVFTNLISNAIKFSGHKKLRR